MGTQAGWESFYNKTFGVSNKTSTGPVTISAPSATPNQQASAAPTAAVQGSGVTNPSAASSATSLRQDSQLPRSLLG